MVRMGDMIEGLSGTYETIKTNSGSPISEYLKANPQPQWIVRKKPVEDFLAFT